MKKILLGSDHGGLELKNKISSYLAEKGYLVEDVGTKTSESCDYPVYAKKLCRKLLTSDFDCGILICGTGLGMQLCANRFKGIRAACVSDTYSAKMSKLHNNSNVLCLGARVLGFGLALEILETWLKTEFEGGRHQKRIDMLDVDLDV